ncbi:hypothetical protein [Halpernia sp.]|uniref:hypothetical protein n=1 Tax=Halpernia sp. TaxID=2782209 RepID=UPI003A953040
MTKKSFLQFNNENFTNLAIAKWLFCVLFFLPIFTFATIKLTKEKTTDSLQISQSAKFYVSGDITISGLENIHHKEVIVLKNEVEQIAKISDKASLSEEFSKAKQEKETNEKVAEKDATKYSNEHTVINFVLPAGGNTDINKISYNSFLAIVSSKSSLKFSPLAIFDYKKNIVVSTQLIKKEKNNSSFSYLNLYKYGIFPLRAPPVFLS